MFVTNATAAVNTVVKQLELGPEDAVLATSHTYNAVNMAVDSAVRRAGADVINVDISLPIRSERDIVGSVAAALLFTLKDHRPKTQSTQLPINSPCMRQQSTATLLRADHGDLPPQCRGEARRDRPHLLTQVPRYLTLSTQYL